MRNVSQKVLLRVLHVKFLVYLDMIFGPKLKFVLTSAIDLNKKKTSILKFWRTKVIWKMIREHPYQHHCCTYDRDIFRAHMQLNDA